MVSDGASGIQRASGKMGYGHLQRGIEMADLLVQQWISVQERYFEWLLLRPRGTTGTVYGKHDICEMGREYLGLG